MYLLTVISHMCVFPLNSYSLISVSCYPTRFLHGAWHWHVSTPDCLKYNLVSVKLVSPYVLCTATQQLLCTIVLIYNLEYTYSFLEILVTLMVVLIDRLIETDDCLIES